MPTAGATGDIVSVGALTGAVALGSATTPGLLRGLVEIGKVDEPTLLVFPENHILAASATLYDEALAGSQYVERSVCDDGCHDGHAAVTLSGSTHRQWISDPTGSEQVI